MTDINISKSGNDTLISVKSEGEYHAVLLDIEVRTITDADIITY